jgi:hypothetical protein
MHRIHRLVGLLAALTMLTALAVPVAAADDNARVRVVHASPDAPNVDIWVDGDRVLSDVPFTAISDYLSLPGGTYNIQVTATGDTAPVIEADLTFEAGMGYTVAAIGMLSEIGATVLTDDLAIADGMSKLRVFHASPSAPASVDVAVTDGPVLVEGLSYPEATGYLTVEAGTYALEIRSAGEAEAALTLSATLAANTNYTAFAMDGGDAGVQVIVAIDATAAHTPDTAVSGASGSALTMVGLVMLASGLVFGGRRLAAARAR